MKGKNKTTSYNNPSVEESDSLINNVGSVGTDGNDLLTGTSGDDNITALGGDDTIIGTAGSDVINGGDGFDTIDYSGYGQAVRIFRGGQVDNGSQSLVLNFEKYIAPAGEANEIDGTSSENFGTSFQVNLASNSLLASNIPTLGNITYEVENFVDVTGTFGNDKLSGNDLANRLIGNDGDDAIDGAEGDDFLDGSAGNDTIEGGAGDDNILGGEGDDFLVGSDGNDNLNGGAGNNRLTGGSGNDVFEISPEGFTTIADFDLNSDVIGLSSGTDFEDLSFSGNKITLNGMDLIAVEGLEASALSAENFTTV